MCRGIFILAFFMMMTGPAFANNIKSPNVSGQFYEADPAKLAQSVENYLQLAKIDPFREEVQIVIVPHAGYVYSGPVAGYGFKAVSQKEFKTIVILAPSHFYGFGGASVWTRGGFQTPLGIVDVDEEFAGKLTEFDSTFSFDPKAFQKEHSLEVEIPFLQKTFENFKIVPVVLGQMGFDDCAKLAKALDTLIGERKDVLVVVSSDMSHYRDHKTAGVMDSATLESIAKLDVQGFYKDCRLGAKEMCGFIPVTTALLLSQIRGLKPRILKYAHSGDVTGDNQSVVGYAAVAFYKDHQLKEKKTADLTVDQKKKLLQFARQTIEQYVTKKSILKFQIEDPRFAFTEGAFVTIHKDGQLRGCIGHIVSSEPLQKTVRDMAVASASEDPRFEPVSVDELTSIDVEISVLSKPWKIKDIEEIILGVHGVIISKKGAHGVFLPQVATETRWDKQKFLSELCRQKAGLPADCWKDPQTDIEIFTAQVFGEKNTH